MRRLLQVSVITSLLVAMASGAYAAVLVRSGKSNSSLRVTVYDSVMTPTEVTAFLTEWDKIPLGSTNEAAVRGILQKVLGNKAGSIKKIIIQTNMKPPRVILLGDPMLESEALRVKAAPFGHNAPLAK